MKTHPLFSVIAGIGLMLALLTLSAMAAEPAAQEHAGHGTTTLHLDHGKKWETDAPLREGMGRIRAAVAGAHADFHVSKFDRQQADALAKAIRAEVAFLFANCKLGADADANLHVLISDMLKGSTAMESAPHGADGLPAIIGALQQYSAYFNDPRWQPLPSLD